MAPSASKTPPGTQMGAPKMSDFTGIGGGGGGGSSIGGSQMSGGTNSLAATTQTTTKDNQRPPVYNAEDYIQSLKKYSRRASGSSTIKSIYDTSSDTADQSQQPTAAVANGKDDKRSASTLPSKHSDYKSPIPTPPANEFEMTLRQFGSITDLLSKLRADLRASFPSFVQELVASPMDGVSLLLEVLRAIQLSGQRDHSSGGGVGVSSAAAPTPMAMRNNQTYQRRALLDELACLQCIHLCTTRCPEAALRLGNTPVGLMPLAAAATGQGIRSRILALQLLTAACDQSLAGTAGHRDNGQVRNSSQQQQHQHPGHNSVSEALSTLRLHCGEPVRFRLLVGMMNSGGGSGELQVHGLKFVNTFVASAADAQNRLYLQAELYQAGLDPMNMANTITESSPWLEKLHHEVRYFEEHKIDVDKLLVQNREAERIRTQMVVLERRVQILHEEKTVLTSMERRLQERCADLQREVFRLQAAHHQDSYKNPEPANANSNKRPVALPRHVPPPGANSAANGSPGSAALTNANKHTDELDDEGISSSETGQSMSPEPCLVLPMGNSQKYRITVTSEETLTSSASSTNAAAGAGICRGTTSGHQVIGNGQIKCPQDNEDTEAAVTIDEVIEELANIVSDEERRSIQLNAATMRSIGQQLEANSRVERDIVPVNLLPQPPRKSRSLVHLLSQRGSEEFDGGSDYGMLMGGAGANNGADVTMSGVRPSYFEDLHYDELQMPQFGRQNSAGAGIQTGDGEPPLLAPDVVNQSSTNREILNVIMDAREKDLRLNGGGIGGLQALMQATEAEATVAVKPDQTADTATATPLVPAVPAHKFSGVFFMTEMSSAQKYPKPDITAALEARRVTKNLDRMESYGSNGIDSMIDIVMTETAQKQALRQQLQQQHLTGGSSILLTGAKQQRFSGPSGLLLGKVGRISGGIGGLSSASTVNGGSRLTDLPSGLY